MKIRGPWREEKNYVKLFAKTNFKIPHVLLN